MSLKDIYRNACEKWKCKPNSGLLAQLENPDQTSLIYSNNYCGSEHGFTCLLAVIEGNPHLKVIDLSSNFLTTENVHALVETLIRHPACTSLKLNNNRLYIDAGKDLLRLARLNRRIIEIETEDEKTKNNNKIPPKIYQQIQRELQHNRVSQAG
eukprot:NODE_9079_length_622_cov_24.392786_g8451_i0.p1 GENE.NODE_9079_length_622_cov_24.392786_g8451_i0~~NODE_9079_length_622_cov_24.392786_g8451_i0.p1  ORF type:complete len:154 (-),score=17.50 NODE_9079_length_622_cov_24.392786_g8451_i0:96-557(-)